MFYRIAGFVCLALAAVGVILPLLPTTPFVLLAATCFAKSSPVLHQKLLKHPVFGPLISRWEDHHCVTRKTKGLAIASILLFGVVPVSFVLEWGLIKLIAYALILVGVVVVTCLPECKHESC